MTATAAPTRSRHRLPARLLAFSPLGFVAVVAAGAATFPASGIDDTAFMTPAQMDDIRLGWLLMWPIYATAVIVGATGLFLLGGRLRSSALATGARVAAALSVVSVLGNLVLNWSMTGFEQARMGEHPFYDTSIFLSLLAIWFGAVSAGLAGLALRAEGRLRRTGLVVAILAAVIVVVDTIVTQGMIPPFVVSFLWLALGIGLLRERVPSTS